MSDNHSPGSDRRTFLTRVGAGAAALGFGAAAPASLAAADPNLLAAALRGAGTGVDPALEAWFKRINGKHRAVFDAPGMNSGFPAIFPRVYLITMNQTYGTKDADNSVVLILRHEAIPMGMQDAMWAKYPFGEEMGVKDGEAPAKRNVYATIEGLPLPGLGVNELLKSNVLVGVCNMALTVASAHFAQKMNLDAATVKQEWIDHLLPGVQVVPSGVMAVGRAQEEGCGYVFAG